MASFYVTTAIPYVNAAPHLGSALSGPRPTRFTSAKITSSGRPRTRVTATGPNASGRCAPRPVTSTSDPTAVCVWFDALTNHITALGYRSESARFRRSWINNPHRVHVIGKDILRFHAVYA